MSEHDDDLLGRAYDHRLMRRLLAYLRPYRWQVAFAIVVVLADVVVQLAGPYLTKEAIDNGIRHKDLQHLDRVAALYFCVLAIGFGLGYLQTQIMQRVGQHIMLDLRLALFRHLQRLPIRYYDRTPVGRLVTRVTNDVDVLNELFTSGVITMIGDFFTLIGILIAMAQLNAELLAVAFSVLPLIFLVTVTFRTKVRRSFRDIRTQLARLNTFLNENLSGMSTVQMLNRERANQEAFRRHNAGHRDSNLQAVFYHALFFPVLELVGASAVCLIVWYGGRQVMWTGITLGTLVAFIQYTQRFFRPISDLSEKYNLLQQAMASSERIFDLLDRPVDDSVAKAEGLAAADGRRPASPPPSVEAEPGPERAMATDGAEASHGEAGTTRPASAPLLGRIEFDRVWFAYQDENWVLQDVSFQVAPGEKVALVGSTGSGKTTLTNLLMRFYDPQRGAVRVDGRDVRDWDAQTLRRSMGLVLQDVFLFSGTVASNLRLGDEALDLATVERAAREVHAHEFVARLPAGYDAPVGERGATFSSGQRQLLAFARALALDPQILVLDEATSSVDTQTEALIQDALRHLMRGRTSLVIAHRLSTIQDVDRIVVLHHGRIREVGTHPELMGRRGIYFRLYQLQAMGGQKRARGEALPPWDEIPAATPIVDSRMGLA